MLFMWKDLDNNVLGEEENSRRNHCGCHNHRREEDDIEDILKKILNAVDNIEDDTSDINKKFCKLLDVVEKILCKLDDILDAIEDDGDHRCRKH